MADNNLEQLLKDRHAAFDKALHYLTIDDSDRYKAAERAIDRIDALIYCIYGSTTETISVTAGDNKLWVPDHTFDKKIVESVVKSERDETGKFTKKKGVKK